MKTAAVNSLRFLLSLSFVVTSLTRFVQAKEFDADFNSAWNEPANWNPNGVPLLETATISNGLTATITGVQVPDVTRLEIGVGGAAGGLLIDGAGGMARLTVLNDVDIGSQGELEVGVSSAHLVVVGPELRNQGDVTVSTGGQITAFQQYIQSDGSTTLLGGSINGTTMRINRGELSGTGQINVGDVRIGTPILLAPPATLSPGVGIGDLAINGDLELTSKSELVVEVDASGPTVLADELSVTGTVTLGGTLDLSNLVGTLTPGKKVAFLVADDVEPGTFFDNILGTETDSGWLFVGYEPSSNGGFTTVSYYPSDTPGDMNGDGFVSELDAPLFAWAVYDKSVYTAKYVGENVPGVCGEGQIGGITTGTSCFGGESGIANMDSIEDLNFLDVQLFLEAVDQFGGDPVVALSEIMSVFNGATVPEPSTLGLVLGAATTLGLRRRRKDLWQGCHVNLSRTGPI